MRFAPRRIHANGVIHTARTSVAYLRAYGREIDLSVQLRTERDALQRRLDAVTKCIDDRYEYAALGVDAWLVARAAIEGNQT